MSRLHKLGKYRDGMALIEYCRVCSAEGNELLEDCPGNFRNIAEKSIDDKKQPDNDLIIENSGIIRK